jgi:predicted house-cleaning noncanonical NTP pyrophosphatase (MazG superfamily)
MTPNRDDLRKLNTLKKFSRELAYSYKGLSEETKEFLNSEDKETLRNLNEFQKNVDEALYILKKPLLDKYEEQKPRHRTM